MIFFFFRFPSDRESGSDSNITHKRSISKTRIHQKRVVLHWPNFILSNLVLSLRLGWPLKFSMLKVTLITLFCGFNFAYNLLAYRNLSHLEMFLFPHFSDIQIMFISNTFSEVMWALSKYSENCKENRRRMTRHRIHRIWNDMIFS